ncbi:MAG: phosphoribosylglycinamide synthetase C domain-containing protein, partial [Candidatus Saccharimonadia bacterium]
IIDSTLGELRRRGIDYRGILYGGVMLTEAGPMILEYNIRLGDPETQVVLPCIQGDVAQMLAMTAAGETPLGVLSTGACVTVVIAADGYPDPPKTGDVITGIEEANAMDEVMVFHAGTAVDDDGNFVTAGGRVLNVTARGNTVAEAKVRAYQAIDCINFRGMQYRSDIASTNT